MTVHNVLLGIELSFGGPYRQRLRFNCPFVHLGACAGGAGGGYQISTGEKYPEETAGRKRRTPCWRHVDTGEVPAAGIGAWGRGGVREPALPLGKRLRSSRRTVVCFSARGIYLCE